MRDDAFIVKKNHIRKSYWSERLEIIISYTKYIFGIRKHGEQMSIIFVIIYKA